MPAAGAPRRWRNPFREKGVASALLTVSSLTVLVKIAGAAKVLFIAHRFGVTDDLDAFFIAFLLPAFFADLSAAPTTAALIPTLVEVRERDGREAARRLAGSVTVWTLAVLLLATVLAGLLSGPLLALLGSGFGPEKAALTRQLFYWLLPILVMSGVGATWRAVLNADHRYALPALVPAVTPLMTIAVVLAKGSAWGVYALVAGSVAGAMLELLVLAAGLRSGRLLGAPRLSMHDRPTRQVMRQYAPTLGSSLVFAGSALVSQSLAAMLGSGSVSALNYAGKLTNMLLAVGPSAIGTVTLTHFSNMIARDSWSRTWETFRAYLRWVLAIAVPATAALILFSEPLVRLLYQRGQFGPDDTATVGAIQRFYLVQIPAAMLVSLGTRLLSSLKSNDAMLWGSLIAVAVQIGLTRWLLDPMGLAGIALAASVSVGVYLCYLLAVLVRWNRAENMPRLAQRDII